jgi:hypothetical protein
MCRPNLKVAATWRAKWQHEVPLGAEGDIHARPYYYAYAYRQILGGFSESIG